MPRINNYGALSGISRGQQQASDWVQEAYAWPGASLDMSVAPYQSSGPHLLSGIDGREFGSLLRLGGSLGGYVPVPRGGCDATTTTPGGFGHPPGGTGRRGGPRVEGPAAAGALLCASESNGNTLLGRVRAQTYQAKSYIAWCKAEPPKAAPVPGRPHSVVGAVRSQVAGRGRSRAP